MTTEEFNLDFIKKDEELSDLYKKMLRKDIEYKTQLLTANKKVLVEKMAGVEVKPGLPTENF